MLAFKFKNTNICQIDKAQNGFEAFEKVVLKFNEVPQQFYDMIILNLDMPIKDGQETCENIIRLFTQPKIFDNDNFMLYIDENVEIG